MNNLPSDFDPEMYKNFNQDLNNMTDEELRNHYLEHGINEHRIYKIDLPENFDPYQYLEFNPDLKDMSVWDLKEHYYLHGQYENRQYVDPHFDKNFYAQLYNFEQDNPDLYTYYAKDIRQCKNSYFGTFVFNSIKYDNKKYIIFINHDSKINGATLSLINLIKKLLQYTFNNTIFLLLDPGNINITIEGCKIISYQKDPTLLYEIIQYYQPKLIYINSCNYAIGKLVNYLDRSKLILHSHEIMQDYYYYIPKNIQPDYVVSSIISQEYINDFDTIPEVFTPFIYDIFGMIVQGKTPIDTIKNNTGNMDISKITIGMCGQITERNNYSLFIKIAQKFSKYNFLWIGDEDINNEIPNVYFAPTGINDYVQYIYQIVDYYLFLSIDDPCPFIILENILFETPCIVFNHEIYYNFQDVLTEDYFHVWADSISETSCTKAIKTYVKTKQNPNKLSYQGLYYILQNFVNRDLSDLLDKIK